MKDHDQLIAYCATLAALVTIFVGALVAAGLMPDLIGKLEAFGLGTICGGLIGVLRSPSPRSMTLHAPPLPTLPPTPDTVPLPELPTPQFAKE